MTKSEIVKEIQDRLNLSSEDSRVRIGKLVQDLYRRLTVSIGLDTTRRRTANVILNSTTNLDLPEVTLDDFSKVQRLSWMVGTRPTVITELSYDDLTNLITSTGQAHYWAAKRMGSDRVTIVLDSFPTATNFTLRVTGIDNGDELGENSIPILPTAYHDLLVEGVMVDELRKMEKPQLAMVAKQTYEEGLSDLRMFLAASAYRDQVQGHMTATRRYPRYPWQGDW